MRILPRAAGLLLTVVAALLLSGCIPPGSTVTPEPMPSSTPVFASEEEALSAAEAAYREYLAVSDAITADAGANPERIQALIAPDQLEEQLAVFEPYSERNLRTEGSTTFDSAELQQYVEGQDGEAAVDFYVCLDVSGVRVFDATGADVTPSQRPSRLPLEIGYVVSAGASPRIVLVRSESWTGDDFCG